MKKSKRIISSVCSAALFLSCIMPTLSSLASAAEEANTLPVEVVSFDDDEVTISSNSNDDEDDLLYNYMLTRSGVEPKYDKTRNGAAVSYQSGISAGERLTGNDAIVYNYLKNEIQKIAAGERTSTAIDIPLSEFGVKAGPWTASELGVTYVYSSSNGWSNEALEALQSKIRYDYDKVYNALLSDCPYELYWCDKTIYLPSCGGSVRVEWAGGEYRLYLTSFPSFTFYVSTDYSLNGAEGTTSLPDGRLSAVNTAIANAQQIVADNSNKTGKELLAAFRDAICGFTTYNNDALGDDVPYGDPWQLIYVFDGDDSTKVVCEGYAKALKYLCDLSTDKLPNISCLIATGTTTGNHMWNVVNMDDNRSYLVDLTACDSAIESMENYLDEGAKVPEECTSAVFLSTPSSGTYNTTYQFSRPRFNFTYNGSSYYYDEQTYSYTYDEDTLAAYDSKYLRLSTIPYVAYTYVPAVAATCDTDGNIAYYTDSSGKYYVMDTNGSYIETTASAVKVPKTGHDWNPPTYTWNGLRSVTAKHICKNDASHVETETATVSSEVLTPASYTSMGWTRYTANFRNSSFATQTKDLQDIPMLVGTEVVIDFVDINGINTSTTVIAETFSAFELPETYLDGYNFIGWTVNGTLYTAKSAAQSALVSIVRAKPADPVKVAVEYEKVNASYSVSVVNGKMSTGKTIGTVQVSKLVTVKANTVSGMQFSHWLRNGVKVSSNSTYSFYMPSENVSLEAVFKDAASAKAGTAIIESVKAASGKLSFVSVLNIPKNCTFVKGGLVATSNSSIGKNVKANNAEYVKLSTKATANTKNVKYTWTKSVSGSTIWYVRGYLVYKDSSGVEHTVYGDCVKANSSGIIY